MDALYNTFTDMIKISLFNKIKTNNPVIDTVITTILITFTSYVVKVAYEYNIDHKTAFTNFNLKEFCKSCFYKKNTILLSGKKCSTISYYSNMPVVSSIFGNRFKAVWQEINNNIDKNTSVYEIKDFLTLTPDPYESENNNNNTGNNKVDDGMYIVSQSRPFLFDKTLQIYATTTISKDESPSDKDKRCSKFDVIDITLYSYHTSLYEMKTHIDNLTHKFIKDIEISRNNKRFIYTLIKTKYENTSYECWKETVFDTTRRFDNMFFEGKCDIVKKIDFFINNKEWYYKKGIPYTLGIGLHGPPGTGKTSFIKSLAIATDRHIKSISFKLLKTRKHLLDFFFENRYRQNNKANSIGFPEKIIVIEDIDAQGDVVLDRSKKNKKEPATSINNLMQTIIQNENRKEIDKDRERERERDRDRDRDYDRDKSNSDKISISSILKPFEDDLITLDDILNIWDGLEENSGRILVISSNHYKDLDPALTRPGRIDITIEMNNASHEIIGEMYKHLYETDTVDMKQLKKIKSYLYSPAEIINIYLQHKDNPDKFICRLQMNKKL